MSERGRTLSETGEFEAIELLRGAWRGAATADSSVSGIVLGSGDDAAVLAPTPRCDLIATTDSFVEGRHFVPGRFTPGEIGVRLAQACASDLAAMAARPRWALLSIGARADHEIDALVAMQSGLAAALDAFGAAIVGGNLVAVASEEWFDLTLLGECERGRAWTRTGAKSGDLIAITGSPGRAGAGWRLVQNARTNAIAPELRPLLDAWIAPTAHVALALALAKSGGVTAAIDISDGFAGDLAHLALTSGVGAIIEESAWPDDPLLDRAARTLGLSIDALRLGPSDDYELLLAIDPASHDACQRIAREAGTPITFVGRCAESESGLQFIARDGIVRELGGSGFDHFGAGG